MIRKVFNPEDLFNCIKIGKYNRDIISCTSCYVDELSHKFFEINITQYFSNGNTKTSKLSFIDLVL